MAGEKQISDGDTDGVSIGQSTTDKVGFHGTAPSAKTALTLTTTAGHQTLTTLAAAFNEVRAVLIAKGLITGA